MASTSGIAMTGLARQRPAEDRAKYDRGLMHTIRPVRRNRWDIRAERQVAAAAVGRLRLCTRSPHGGLDGF
jgi:hypothetical protein